MVGNYFAEGEVAEINRSKAGVWRKGYRNVVYSSHAVVFGKSRI